jgi:mannose-6-phosphate isomerase-like protein (cupin superfamily)
MTDGWIARWDALDEQRFAPTVGVRVVNATGCQLCRFRIEEGTPRMPAVEHEAEQLTVMLEGAQRVRLGEVEQEVRPGAIWAIPARLEHASQLRELPSSVLDFHVPHRPEFVPGGVSPRPGPPGRMPPRFSRWDAQSADAVHGGERRCLMADRGLLTRLIGDGPFAIPPGGERIVSLERGRIQVRAGDRRGEAGPGSVWVVPAGVAQDIAVLDGPIELLDFQDIRPRQEGAA